MICRLPAACFWFQLVRLGERGQLGAEAQLQGNARAEEHQQEHAYGPAGDSHRRGLRVLWNLLDSGRGQLPPQRRGRLGRDQEDDDPAQQEPRPPLGEAASAEILFPQSQVKRANLPFQLVVARALGQLGLQCLELVALQRVLGLPSAIVGKKHRRDRSGKDPGNDRRFDGD